MKNVRYFRILDQEVPVVFNAGAISKWMARIGKTESDVLKTMIDLNSHEICQLIYTGMEYGYGIQGAGRCPYSFYEVEEYVLEVMQMEHEREYQDLIIFGVECVSGRMDALAKKNGFDLNLSEFAQKMREVWQEKEIQEEKK